MCSDDGGVGDGLRPARELHFGFWCQHGNPGSGDVDAVVDHGGAFVAKFGAREFSGSEFGGSEFGA